MYDELSLHLSLAQANPELLDNSLLVRPLPEPKLHGKSRDVLDYLRTLHEVKMAVLVHPSQSPPAADGASVPPAGSFGVPKHDLPRAITNRMGRNASELAMRIASLPHGSMFRRLILRLGQYYRVDLDDLPDHFHDLREEDRSALRNHLGTPYCPKNFLRQVLSSLMKKLSVIFYR